MPDEINCSHINRSNAIKKRIQFLQSANSDDGAGVIKQLHTIWDDHEDLPIRHTVAQITDLKNKIRRTIDGIETYLLEEGILVRDNTVGADDTNVTNLGIKMLRDDLLGENDNAGRASSDIFKNIAPNYMKQFINYIHFISALSQEEQKLFLRRFPPDQKEEYQCHGGAKTRLDDVLKIAKPSAMVLHAHNDAVNDVGTQFRKSLDSGNHPHAESFAEYLVGVSDIGELLDGMYLTPRNQITLSQIHDLIHNYDEKLSASYQEILKRKTGALIDEIVQITVEDNDKALTGEAQYRRKEIHDLCKDILDIDDEIADMIVGALSEMSEIVDENNDTKDIYWKVDEQGESGIRETLLAQINQVMEGKSNYFQRVRNERRENSMPVNLTSLSNVNELIESIKTLILPFDYTSGSCPRISDVEKNAIYALRALCQESKDQDIFHFIAASDHLIDTRIGSPEECKNHILDKIKADDSLQGDTILTDFINCIFDKREIYLGADNTYSKVEDTHPLLNAILTKDAGKVSEILATNDEARFAEEFTRNDGDSRGKSRSPSYYAFRINDKDIASEFLRHPVFRVEPTTAGNQTFNIAASDGLCETVKAFLEADIEDEILQATDKSGDTALHLAASKGHTETVKTLLAHKKDIFIDTKNKANVTAFYIAAFYGHNDTIDVFLEEEDKQFIKSKNASNDSTAFHCAAKLGHTQIVQTLLDLLDNDLLHATDTSGNTALHLAAANGHVKVTQTLLDLLDNDLLHAKNGDGDTVLHCAATNKHDQIAQDIIKNKDKNFLGAKNNNNMTALQIAAQNKDSKTVQVIIDRLEELSNQEEGHPTAFDLALGEEETNTSEIFLTYCRADLLNVKDKDGNTAFHRAIIDDDMRLVEKFLNYAKPEVLNVKDEDGNTAFHRAIIDDDMRLVEKFLNYAKPEVLNAEDKDGNTAFHRAIIDDDMRLLEKFLDYAKPEVLNAEDKDGNTAFHRAIIDDDMRLVEKFLDYAKPEVLNAKDKDGNTAFHLAVLNGNAEVVEKFLNYAKPEVLNARDEDGNTSFHLAVLNGNAEVVEKFLNYAKPEVLSARDKGDNTAFHLAALDGDVEIMKKFFYLAKPEVLNAKVRFLTALQRAIKNDDVETLKIFLDHADLEILDDPKYSTAFNYAALIKSGASIETIFDSDRYLKSVDKNGSTLLHRITNDHNPIPLEEFLNHPKAEVLPVQDNDGNTAFHIAALRGYGKHMKLFLDHSNTDMLSAKNKKGYSAFDIAARGSYCMSHHYTYENSKNIKMFLDAKKPGSLNDDGSNDLPCEFEAIKSLLKKGIFLNKREFADRPELQEIIITARRKAKMLIERIRKNDTTSVLTFINGEAPEDLAGYINVSSSHFLKCSSKTPLQKAAELGKTEIMELLISKGADVNIVNEYGYKALDYAIRRNRTEAIALLNTPRTSVENPTVQTAQAIISR